MEIRRAAIAGAVAAILVMLVVRFAAQPADRALLAQPLLGVLLAWTGAIYLGASLAGRERLWLAAEAAASIAVLVFAGLGLSGNPKWLAAGYLVHGGWAAAHQPRRSSGKAV